MRNFFYLTILAGLLFTSCSSSEEALPAGTLKSNDGLRVDLEWNTGGSSQKALDDADLDLFLNFEGDNVESSSSYSSFESVQLKDIYQDGTYEVLVQNYGSSVRVDYTIYVSSNQDDSSEKYEGYFESGDQGSEIVDIRIRKNGDTYEIID